MNGNNATRRLTKHTMSKRALALLERQIESARALHPVAVMLADTLHEAAKRTQPDSPERERIVYVERQVGDLFSPYGPRYADLDQADVLRILTSLKLYEPGQEVYRLVVAGEVVSTFLARNRWHACNYARKYHGVDVAEYRFAGGRHEVHAERSTARPMAEPSEFVTICGDCQREVPPCAACDRGEATQASPHVHHECAPMHARNARAERARA